MNPSKLFNLKYWARKIFAIKPFRHEAVTYKAAWPFVSDARVYEFSEQRSYLFVAEAYVHLERSEIIFVVQPRDEAGDAVAPALVADFRQYEFSSGKRNLLFYANPVTEPEHVGRIFAAEQTFDHTSSPRIGI